MLLLSNVLLDMEHFSSSTGSCLYGGHNSTSRGMHQLLELLGSLLLYLVQPNHCRIYYIVYSSLFAVQKVCRGGIWHHQWERLASSQVRAAPWEGGSLGHDHQAVQWWGVLGGWQLGRWQGWQ